MMTNLSEGRCRRRIVSNVQGDRDGGRGRARSVLERGPPTAGRLRGTRTGTTARTGTGEADSDVLREVMVRPSLRDGDVPLDDTLVVRLRVEVVVDVELAIPVVAFPVAASLLRIQARIPRDGRGRAL